ncbi:hypothetical protein CER18_08380 [Bartonella tribocorum]|uniref:Uncharacterized protein n=1 Tax=Bartonella tribocorum TaxID=85701 RepID=A0A2N9Y8S3_9HYPH|nr:hypothetical protein CER18_08380 [Bartonella tribocorum]
MGVMDFNGTERERIFHSSGSYKRRRMLSVSLTVFVKISYKKGCVLKKGWMRALVEKVEHQMGNEGSSLKRCLSIFWFMGCLAHGIVWQLIEDLLGGGVLLAKGRKQRGN